MFYTIGKKTTHIPSRWKPQRTNAVTGVVSPVTLEGQIYTGDCERGYAVWKTRSVTF